MKVTRVLARQGGGDLAVHRGDGSPVGLEVSSYVDERRDPLKATVARAFKVDADDVEELNPHLVRKVSVLARHSVPVSANRGSR